MLDKRRSSKSEEDCFALLEKKSLSSRGFPPTEKSIPLVGGVEIFFCMELVCISSNRSTGSGIPSIERNNRPRLGSILVSSDSISGDFLGKSVIFVANP